MAALIGAALGAVLVASGPRLRRAAGEATTGELVALDKISDAQATLATCVIDANQAAFYLIQGINNIEFSAECCRVMESRENRTACATSVTTAIASFGWVVSYVSAAINSCGSETNKGAACADSMGGFAACLGEFGFVASAVVDACDSISLLPLDPDEYENSSSSNRGWSISQCIVDIDVGVTYVGRIGIQLYFLTTECPETGSNYDRKRCALDIFNLISAVAWAAQFLAGAAVDCPAVNNNPAGAVCAGVISDFVATVAALGPLVNGITDDCQPLLSGAGVGDAGFN